MVSIFDGITSINIEELESLKEGSSISVTGNKRAVREVNKIKCLRKNDIEYEIKMNKGYAKLHFDKDFSYFIWEYQPKTR